MLLLLETGQAGLTVRGARVWQPLTTRVRARRLDRAIAAGTSPDATADLAFRAQTLVRMSVRRDLAKTVERIVAVSTRPASSARPAVPVCRDRVAEASEELQGLSAHLLAPGPVSAQGVALVSVFLSDGSGPLYHRGNTDDLRSRISEMVEALSPSRDLHGTSVP